VAQAFYINFFKFKILLLNINLVGQWICLAASDYFGLVVHMLPVGYVEATGHM
jgi:hypothetical protein